MIAVCPLQLLQYGQARNASPVHTLTADSNGSIVTSNKYISRLLSCEVSFQCSVLETCNSTCVSPYHISALQALQRDLISTRQSHNQSTLQTSSCTFPRTACRTLDGDWPHSPPLNSLMQKTDHLVSNETHHLCSYSDKDLAIVPG